jgi:hypothetical protein
MGKSPSLQDLENKEDQFRAYLTKLQSELQGRSSTLQQQMEGEITQFYTQNKYTDATDMVSGLNYDFLHQSEFTLDNLKTVIDAISKAVFAGTKPPGGATVNDGGTKAAASALGPEVGEMANLELYIAGQVFDVLSNVILSFGTSTAVTFNTNLQSKPLGYGLQLFTAVSADSYRSTSFFNNEYINEYLYLYDVKFSALQAKKEITQTLIELYQDQIAAFKQREESLLKQLEEGTLDATAYESANGVYDRLIAAAQKKVGDLKTAAAAQQVRSS